jgi:hypothetical protein
MYNEVMKRGVKFAGAAIRGAKHIPGHLRDLDTLARKTANTLEQAGNFAAVVSGEFGNDRLRDTANKLAKTSAHINNVRHGATANAIRGMIDAPQNRGSDDYWTPPFANSDY